MRLPVYADTYPDDEALECPMPGCESIWTHLRSVTCYERPDGEDTETHAYTITGHGYEGCDVVGDDENPSARRDATVLHFECEWGHVFDVQFVQHKGNTFFGTINARDNRDFGKPVQP